MFSGARRILPASTDVGTLILAVAAALILAGVLKDFALLALGRDRELTNLLAFVTFDSGTDSWMPMYRAVELFRSDPDAGIYTTIFFDQQTKFQYPPTSLLPILALSALGVGEGLGVRMLQGVSWLGVLGLAAVVALIYRELKALPGLAAFRALPGADWLAICALAVGTLTFDPVMFAYELGQIQVLIDLAVGAALLFLLRGRAGWAGALMALAALVKPQYGVILVWALLRREHGFTKGFLGVGIPAGLLSLLVFGPDEHFSYLSVISYIGRHGELFWANQSVNGLLNRLLVEGGAMTWNAQAFAPHHPVVYAGTLLSTLAFVVFGLWLRPGGRPPKDVAAQPEGRLARALDFATMIVALTLASPIAWEHHYGVAWPIMVVALLALLDLRTRRPERRIDALLVGLACSYWLVSNYLTQLFPVIDTPLEALQSYYLVGGLALLAVLAGVRIAMAPRGGAAVRGAPGPRPEPAAQSDGA